MTNQLTLFVGDNDGSLALSVLKLYPTAYLIDTSNYSYHHYGTCYTSLKDLPDIPTFASLLRRANNIIYSPPSRWNNDQKIKKYSARYWTEQYLYTFSLDTTKQVINAPQLHTSNDVDTILNLNDQRKHKDKNLWVSGCSFTYGVGVNENERYANLLAKELNLPLSMLAKSGASISYSADQILRSDIRENDIVIWGITDHQRITHYDQPNNQIININVGKFHDINKKFDFFDPTLMYSSITAIHQVINFCNKIKAKLVLAGVFTNLETSAYLKNVKSYIHLNSFYGVKLKDRFLDVGDDSVHPGPLTHIWYAEKILDKLKEIE